MNVDRIQAMLKSKEKTDVFYEDRPVWIQEIHDNVATVGFIDNNEEKDVYIEELYEYENDLYNK